MPLLQMSTNPGDLPDPAMFEHLRRASSTGQPRTPITVALPATRQLDKPARAHRTHKLGNPAVPVASATPPRQQSAPHTDSTQQVLSLGVPANNSPEMPSTSQGPTAQSEHSRPRQPQRDSVQQPLTEQDNVQLSLSGQGSMQQPLAEQDDLQQPLAGQNYGSLGTAGPSATTTPLAEQYAPIAGAAQLSTSGTALGGRHEASSLVPAVSEARQGEVSGLQDYHAAIGQQGNNDASSQQAHDGLRRPDSLREPLQAYQQGQGQHDSRQASLSTQAPDWQHSEHGQATQRLPAIAAAETQAGLGPGHATDSSQAGAGSHAAPSAGAEVRHNSPVRARIQALEAQQSQRSFQSSRPQHASSLGPYSQLQPAQGNQAFDDTQGERLAECA